MLMSLSETISISICDIAVQFCGHMQDTLGTVEEKQEVEQTDTKWTFLWQANILCLWEREWVVSNACHMYSIPETIKKEYETRFATKIKQIKLLEKCVCIYLSDTKK